ncbi:MAG: hypothetical protein JO112_16430 [Planctomycetes bacterium]|nr:hypothetical protein [Planctomycetota bacterium]
MKRTTGLLVLLAAVGGYLTMGSGMVVWGQEPRIGCAGGVPYTVPGVQGPWGAPVTMIPPYTSDPPNSERAREMIAQSLPLNMVQTAGGMMPPGVINSGPGAIAPPGMPIVPPVGPPGAVPGAVAAVGALTNGMPSRFATQRTSVRFVSPAGMKIAWFAPSAPNKNGFATTQLEVPGRYNFAQGAIYRLKLTNVPGRPNLELYPTLEVVPSNAKSNAFLAHSAVPVAFTEEDFEQVAAGNFVVKVIYLPDPTFQDLATTGTDEVVSTRLEPGVDPIAEAYRRGSILLVVRLGNIDLESPNTPAMDAPSPFAPRLPMLPPAGMNGMMGPGMPGPGPMVPYGAMGKTLMMGPNGPPMMMTPNGLMPAPEGATGTPGPMMDPHGATPGSNGATLPPGMSGQPPAIPNPTPSSSSSLQGTGVPSSTILEGTSTNMSGSTILQSGNYPNEGVPASVAAASYNPNAAPAKPAPSLFQRLFMGLKEDGSR